MREFTFPRVVESPRPVEPQPQREVPNPQPPAQRELVAASLVRCPPAPSR